MGKVITWDFPGVSAFLAAYFRKRSSFDEWRQRNLQRLFLSVEHAIERWGEGIMNISNC